MIEIIEKGKLLKARVKCPECGCVFSFDKRDVLIDSMTYKKYIPCPYCQIRILDWEWMDETAPGFDLLNTELYYYDFSTRVWNILREHDIRTVRDLIQLSLSDFMAFRNWGEGCMKELCVFLDKNNLKLKEDGQDRRR
jgi:DNA-directed RNA polymerase alpha subunit